MGGVVGRKRARSSAVRVTKLEFIAVVSATAIFGVDDERRGDESRMAARGNDEEARGNADKARGTPTESSRG